MATIPKTNVLTGNIVEASDITNIINALDGTTVTDIIISGSFIQGKSARAVGDGSHAEGAGYAAASSSHAEGQGQTLGDYSHAEGTSISQGDYSHAEGQGNSSDGDYSHAEGYLTRTTGLYSHTEGYFTRTFGNYSHAEGSGSITIGSGSHAEGEGTIASGSFQHVSGRFNTHNDTSSLFIVGNGTSTSSRSDAFKITMSGSIMVQTGSALPTWEGKEGEMKPVKIGSNYFIATYIGGAWRSASLF